ncbi:unnamed protein product, partial [Tenebrio molitor]
MIFLALCEKRYSEQSSSFHRFAWSIDSAGLEAKQSILNKSAISNVINYISLLLTLFIIVLNLPIWGNERELFLSVEVFEYIFGNWAKIPHTIYFATVPYLSYTAFRTDRIFDALGTCSWYIWNIKNRKTLLIFMANSLQPFRFYFAGFTVDYKL